MIGLSVGSIDALNVSSVANILPRSLASWAASTPVSRLRHVLVNRKAQLVALSGNFEALLREGHRDGAIVVLGPSTTQQLAFLQPLQLMRNRRLRQDHFLDELAHTHLIPFQQQDEDT